MVSTKDLTDALEISQYNRYDKSAILAMIDTHTDIVKLLSEAKDKDGNPLFSSAEINAVLYNCKDTIEKHPDRIKAILSNPEEINIISNFKNKAMGLWKAVVDPLNSTIEQNPQAFGIKPEAKKEEKYQYDKSIVSEMKEQHPDMVKFLSEVKGVDGKQLFSSAEIDDVLYNCKDTIEKHPDRIKAVLNNPEEIDIISDFKNKAAGLWRAVGDPLNSTIEQNPQAFDIKPEAKKKKKQSASQHLEEARKRLAEKNGTNLETTPPQKTTPQKTTFSILEIWKNRKARKGG